LGRAAGWLVEASRGLPALLVLDEFPYLRQEAPGVARIGALP
jgi:hypothetical protein